MLKVVKKRERIDGDVVRRLCLRVRENRELTQGEVARMLGANVSMVQRIEQGIQRTFPRAIFDALVKLDEELKTSR